MESITQAHRRDSELGGAGGSGSSGRPNGQQAGRGENCSSRYFQMPLHYPRYKKADYEAMPEWKLDHLLAEYGLPTNLGDVEQKRKFAMGAFLWPHH